MGRLLAIAAILAAVVAGVTIWLSSGLGTAVVVSLVAIFAGVACLMAGRGTTGLATAIVLFVLAVVCFLFSAGSIGGKSGALDLTGIDATFRENVFPALVALAAVASLAILSWDRFEPSWLAIALVAGLVLTAALTFVFSKDIGNPTSLAMVPGILAILCAGPAVYLLAKNGYDAPVATTTSTRRHA